MSSQEIINLKTKVKQKENLPTVMIGDEVAMMNIQNGKYYSMDPVGSDIWAMIANEMTVNEIVLKLLQEYEINEETCKAEVIQFLQHLSDEGLIKVRL